jgi:hypothetical protein
MLAVAGGSTAVCRRPLHRANIAWLLDAVAPPRATAPCRSSGRRSYPGLVGDAHRARRRPACSKPTPPMVEDANFQNQSICRIETEAVALARDAIESRIV